MSRLILASLLYKNWFDHKGQDVPQHPWGHAIRLAGPWEYAGLNPQELTTSSLMRDKRDWQRFSWPFSVEQTLSYPRTPLFLRRRFHAPTGLKGQTVWLCLPDEIQPERIELNGQTLSLHQQQNQFTVEIQDVIQPDNLLMMAVVVEDLLAAIEPILLIIKE